ncbi:probable G-protein coupled receptor No18 [Parasteatoda tepidariorum]|uniref:probable G-protein coupled receptor No18 n=1 Tax=Parasteatoda tepidariorum TaxID=114398 RepID=UPI00077FB7F7|nr:probable G-protein coupled receptor No18 [Parasteatoda tepidariorum]
MLSNISLYFIHDGYLTMDIVVEDIIENVDNSTETEFLEEPMSTIEAVTTALILSIIILATVIGNILVIMSVFTYRPLQNVQNMFIVSLAVADITVAVLVMPLNVAYTLMAQWKFGLSVCKMWLTCDVMCCTASILNLCAIALDRYWAIHDPINYASKRTLSRVMLMIAAVWGVSLTISAPPLVGWNDWPEEFADDTPCMLTEEKAYVVFSASGSFFIPLAIMMVVYIKIFEAAKQRIRSKAKAAAKLAAMRKSPDTASSSIPLKSIQSEISTIAVTDDSTSSSANNKGSDEKSEKDPANKEVATTEFADNHTLKPPPMNPRPGRTLVPDGNPRLTATVRHYMREKQKICLSKERRAARVLGIVMGVFVLCWLPFFLMYVILPFCETCYVSSRVVNFVTWLGYVNSALNPVIYTVFNMDFRKAFLIILCRRR